MQLAAPAWAKQLDRKLLNDLAAQYLELGGNNAMIVMLTADLDMAVCAILFSAVGTYGQRCTSLRRLIVHKDVKDKLLPKVKKAYASVSIGNPLDGDNLVGPLIDEDAYMAMESALQQAESEGTTVYRMVVFPQPSFQCLDSREMLSTFEWLAILAPCSTAARANPDNTPEAERSLLSYQAKHPVQPLFLLNVVPQQH